MRRLLLQPTPSMRLGEANTPPTPWAEQLRDQRKEINETLCQLEQERVEIERELADHGVAHLHASALGRRIDAMVMNVS